MSELRRELEAIFGPLPERGVTGVTGVTSRPVTPEKRSSYNGYVGYASGAADPQIRQSGHVTDNPLGASHPGGWKPHPTSDQLDALPHAFRDALHRFYREQPKGASVERWKQATKDASRILERWGEVAMHLGWSADDLLAWSPSACSGLAWEACGRDIVLLTEGGAHLGPSEGAGEAWFARPLSTGRRSDASTP